MRGIYVYWTTVLLFCSPSWVCAAHVQQPEAYDVVIYGGSSAGIAAAVQAKRMGRTVVVIEPSNRIGGLTTGGLGQTDIGAKAAIGGIARDFYQRIRKHYLLESSWKWQQKKEYRSGGQSRTADGEDAMWTFEPSAALNVMQQWVDENHLRIVYSERLDRSDTGVVKLGRRVESIRMQSGRTFAGKVFIDATYEGDLLAAAGVSYTVGREANATYGETLSGVQTQRAVHHQFVAGVDPYVVPGDVSSGLLPGIDPAGPGKEGAGDNRVQAYCFRMCLTDHPDNQIPFHKPESYIERDYELLFRNFEAGAKNLPWSNSSMPNRKTDVNNNKGFSTDFIGQNYDYPEASYEQRERIVDRHLHYQQGLMWTLANHPRVPAWIRKEVSVWGTCKDEFESDTGWQQQLYIREARRMIGSYVMSQLNCQGEKEVRRSIGLAAYTMDSHQVQRYVASDGFVRNEGDVQVGGFSPFPIEYGAITPQSAECTNMLVPVCLSASHMAFGSIRMEPVFMVLGQTAATAAVHSIDEGVDVQNVNYEALKARLLADGQVLEWTGRKKVAAKGIALKSLTGLVLDDQQSERVGFETQSTSNGPFVDIGYRHDGNDAKGRQRAVFRFRVITAGKYKVQLGYSAFSNRATNVPISMTQAGDVRKFVVNQRQKPKTPPFETFAELQLSEGEVVVEVSNAATDGYVIVDAVRLLAL